MQENENINYAKQHHTPHCWLPAKVMYPAISTKRFSWLTRSTAIFIVEERLYIYMCVCMFPFIGFILQVL